MKVGNRRIAGLLIAALAQASFAQNFDSARVTTQRVGDDLYVVFSVIEEALAGNMLVSLGEQGTLLVDDQFAELAPKYLAAIAAVGGGPQIAFVINTHWHFDHADGNKALGPTGTWFVAHENSRRMLMQDNVIDLVGSTMDQPAYPAEARPVVTFDQRMKMHFNGHEIELLHAGPAHTLGDAAVIFRDANIVHLGDVFHSSEYPFIDEGNGGSLQGVVEFCQAVLDRIDSATVVIPGHGPVSDYRGLADYVSMLHTIYDRMHALTSTGASLEQVLAARPTADWDDERGDPSRFITQSYASMTP